MATRFSDRIGVTSASDVLQCDGMTQALRNSLWNYLLKTFFLGNSKSYPDTVKPICEFFLKLPLDSLPIYYEQKEWLKEVFFSDQFPWFQVYNLIEFVATHWGGMRYSFNLQ